MSDFKFIWVPVAVLSVLFLGMYCAGQNSKVFSLIPLWADIVVFLVIAGVVSLFLAHIIQSA